MISGTGEAQTVGRERGSLRAEEYGEPRWDDHPEVNRRPLVPRRRRVTTVVGVLACLALLAAGGAGFALTQGGRATPVALDDAVSQFRTDRAPAASEAVASEPGSSGSSSEPSEDAGYQLEAGAAPEAAVAAPAQETNQHTRPYVLPAEGVYTYRASGGEQISMPGGRRTYPERFHATVRHLEGCLWELRNDIVREHVDVVHLCSQAGSFSQHMQSRTVEFFGRKEGGPFICDPQLLLHKLGDSSGAEAMTRCTDESGNQSELRRVHVGQAEIAVNGTAVPAVHYRIEGSFSGSYEGSSVDELWVSADTGLPLRWERSVDNVSTFLGARVHYTENATFELESLRPAT